MVKRFADQRIKDEFIRLLNIKPYNKIRVSEIVENCGINRNTFYYHFDNLFDVLDSIFQYELSKLSNGYYDGETYGGVLRRTTAYLNKNKTAVINLYNSVQRDDFRNFFCQFSHGVLAKFIETDLKEINLEPLDKKLLAKMMEHALSGLLIEWIGLGMRSDINIVLQRMDLISTGKFKLVFENPQN